MCTLAPIKDLVVVGVGCTVLTEHFNVGMKARKEDCHGVIDSGVAINDESVLGLIRHAVNMLAFGARKKGSAKRRNGDDR
jgi:hypothetical protein